MAKLSDETEDMDEGVSEELINGIGELPLDDDLGDVAVLFCDGDFAGVFSSVDIAWLYVERIDTEQEHTWSIRSVTVDGMVSEQ